MWPPRPRVPPEGGEERVTGRRDLRMRMVLESAAEIDRKIRRDMEKRLQVIEEVALSPPASGTGGPGVEEAKERIRRALERSDRRAEDEAVVDSIRAVMREWWPDFPEGQLLTDLFRRAARRRAGCGSLDSRRRPSHGEGLRVARGLLVDIPDTSRLDSEYESKAVSVFLGTQLLTHIGESTPDELSDYIERSWFSRVYFDALWCICEVLSDRGEAIPRPLIRWLRGVALGRRWRPVMMAVQAHRPVNWAHLERDFQVHFIIEVLSRVGVPPRGIYVSGCRIVSEAIELSEETVIRIWKERAWKRSFEPELRKYVEATAARTGLYYTTEA